VFVGAAAWKVFRTKAGKISDLRIILWRAFPHAVTVEAIETSKGTKQYNYASEVRVFTARCWATPRSLLDNRQLNN
jgi:hypothetical protein